MSNPFNRDYSPKVGQPLELQSGVSVVTAPNASPMTFTGTQTYLVGWDSLAIIDPGPENEAHFQSLITAINGRNVSHILITHSHVDHSPLSRRLSEATKAPIYGFGIAEHARTPRMAALAASGELGGQEGIDKAYRPEIMLQDGEIVAGEGWNLRVLHTPGHLADHVCFAWEETGAVFTGDHVMSWATTMVSPPDGDLTSFLDSLRKLSERKQDKIYYPGHGAPVTDPKEMVQHQLEHRKNRENQILAALKTGESGAYDLANRIYTDVDQRLIPAAARNVFAHLIDLEARKIVQVGDTIRFDATFRLK